MDLGTEVFLGGLGFVIGFGLVLGSMHLFRDERGGV